MLTFEYLLEKAKFPNIVAAEREILNKNELNGIKKIINYF
jgi:hypothetical protein